MAKILIVDSDQAMTTALAVRLRGAGYVVLCSHGCEAAATVALRERPDLIVLDVDLPVFTGLEFHECLKVSGRSRDIPVIYLSANDSPASRLVALRQGAHHFITKPYDPPTLIAAIEDGLRTVAV